MGKIKKVSEEFYIQKTVSKDKINQNILEFKKVNPDYTVFNINVAMGTGSDKVFIIWRRT